MKILGIDPGTGRTGWGVIQKLSREDLDNLKLKSTIKVKQNVKEKILEYIAHGCVVTTQVDTMQKRLEILHKSVNEIIKNYKPDFMVIEQIFFGRNTKTAISVGQARGVVMLSASYHNLPIFEYTGISVKYHLSGNGRADKKDIQKIVRRMLNKDKRKLSFNAKDKGYDDSADALAIAIYHSTKT